MRERRKEESQDLASIYGRDKSIYLEKKRKGNQEKPVERHGRAQSETCTMERVAGVPAKCYFGRDF